MAAQILHRGATVNCSHSPPGRATPTTVFARVKLSGQEVVTLTNLYSIAACPLNSPCATGQWTSGASRVRAGGAPVAVFDGNSTCVPTGAPMRPLLAQTRVRAA